ncbi:farnesyl-diphosphate synthase [Lanmaoa asiatica]|nr:farnesyl-diphosphate synthase [Lanmaoa asiatica]
MGIVDITKQRSNKLDTVFEHIRDDVIVYVTKILPMEAVEWFRCNLEFNVPHEKLNRIMSVVDFVEILRGRMLSDDEYFKAALLEWCINLLHASRSHVCWDQPNRHGNQQCWYAGDDIVLKDSLWLNSVMFYLLKKYFCMETYYVHLLELIQDTTFQMEMGQLVNSITTSKDHVDLSKFSLQKYGLITRRKVASFYLPVALAMCVCGVPESYTLHGCLFSPYTTARSILLQLCEYHQMQYDFLSYVGTTKGVCKTRTDIMGNTCSWCINVALVIASPEQRKVLEENYGQTDPEMELRVKEIYETIGLRERYQVSEASLKERIEASIAEIPEPEGNMDGGVLKREVFACFLNEIYKGTM